MTTIQPTRRAQRSRKTGETDIVLSLHLDGFGSSTIETGIGFFDHMLHSLAKHSSIDIDLRASGDLMVDPHHTVEDCGLVLGAALADSLGDKAGIARFGFAYAPLDDALARSVIDLSGRPYCQYAVPIRAKKLGTFDTELVEDFLRAFATEGRFNLHVDLIRGRNSHHVVEAVFKSLALALRSAIALTGKQGVPSTKGTLTR
jgi:imidazoleglycerol-phosphate dehydratase